MPAEFCRNKSKIFAASGFRLCRLDDDAETLAGPLHYPCIVKPLGLSGSQGVIRVNDEAEFVRAEDNVGTDIPEHVSKFIRRLLDDAREGNSIDDAFQAVLPGVFQSEGHRWQSGELSPWGSPDQCS